MNTVRIERTRRDGTRCRPDFHRSILSATNWVPKEPDTSTKSPIRQEVSKTTIFGADPSLAVEQSRFENRSGGVFVISPPLTKIPYNTVCNTVNTVCRQRSSRRGFPCEIWKNVVRAWIRPNLSRRKEFGRCSALF
ncbi:unnamed protein product [Ectocarpus sp. 4 AP-2014]